MSDIQLNPQSDEERKRKERAAFEAYFTNERVKEEKRNRTAIIWVIIVGVGLPLIFSILYFLMIVFIYALGH